MMLHVYIMVNTEMDVTWEFFSSVFDSIVYGESFGKSFAVNMLDNRLHPVMGIFPTRNRPSQGGGALPRRSVTDRGRLPVPFFVSGFIDLPHLSEITHG